MRGIVILAAMLAAVASGPQPAEAGDRGFHFRHFSPHAGTKLHGPHHGLKLHRRDVFGKHRHLEPRVLSHSGRGGLVLKFDHHGFVAKHRHFEPRRFGQFSRGGLVLKFGDGDVVLKFGHIPRLKPGRFEQRHGKRGLFFGFDRPRHLRPLHLRDLVLKDRHDLHGRLRHFRAPSLEGGVHGGAPPEALLERLEELGFREVPELLRNQSR